MTTTEEAMKTFFYALKQDGDLIEILHSPVALSEAEWRKIKNDADRRSQEMEAMDEGQRAAVDASEWLAFDTGFVAGLILHNNPTLHALDYFTGSIGPSAEIGQDDE